VCVCVINMKKIQGKFIVLHAKNNIDF